MLRVASLLLLLLPLSKADNLTFQMNQGYRYHTVGAFPFQNTSLPWEERVDDLVKRLSVEEIAQQTLATYGSHTPAIPSLGIKPYIWITECLHGQVNSNTTGFPQSIGLAASFSTELLYLISEAISYEVRAHWNGNRAQGIYSTMYGLSCFSPVINIMRHPLWGRNQETYGEDPYLSGRLVQSFVRGLQGDHPRYVRANAGCKHFDVHGGPENIPVSRFSFDAKETYGEDPYLSGRLVQEFVRGLQGTDPRYVRANAGCKHFDVHGGPENIPVDRGSFDAKVGMRDWRMTFLPQFKMCVEAGSYSLMCSYNSINGVPACANQKLLTDITRKEWGFKGYVVSDAGAISNIISQHHYCNNSIETVTASMKAGCNLELGSDIFLKQVDAMKAGKLTEQEIRENVKPLFYTRMRLGEFDPEDMNPYNKIDMSEIQSSKHRELAIRAAMESFVLLKNRHEVLPLKGPVDRLAIVGPFANNSDQLFGDYGSNVLPQFTETPYEGLKTLGTTVEMAPGCDDTKCASYNYADLERAVRGSQLVIVCLGTGQAVESEGNDRADLDLPGKQLQLLQDAAFFAEGAPVILLLFNAGPLDITWAKLSDQVPVIMECFFPAQSTGQALYNVLTKTGEYSVPAGRLPATWPAFINQVPPITDYTMDGRTYRYYHGTPLYPFGFGLSYSRFEYTSLSVSSATVKVGDSVSVKVRLTNLGPHDAAEVIQLYMAWGNTSVPVPRHQLVGFERRYITAHQDLEVEFVIVPEQMAVWIDDDRGFGTMMGPMYIFAGGQQPFQRESVGSNVLDGKFVITE